MLDSLSDQSSSLLPKDLCFVIFGATGDLTQHKLMPALFRLHQEGRMPDDFNIVACGRRELSHDDYRRLVAPALEPKKLCDENDDCLDRFLEHIDYFQGNIDDTYMYLRLESFLQNQKYSSNIVFYLAIGSDKLPQCVECLAGQHLFDEDQCIRRVVVEKPIGKDYNSAQETETILSDHLLDHQIFRIDHYLAKEMVQNLLVFRFSNIFMEPLWNRNYIDHIQITHSETLGVGSRAGFYDTHGATRDMIQSHMLQLLALVAMEPPLSSSATDLRQEKIKVLNAIRPLTEQSIKTDCYRAQYESGWIEEESVLGYLSENGVSENSNTETYSATKFYIDNWRWQGVPIYLRTGKRLKERHSLISICFKNVPQQFIKDNTSSKSTSQTNRQDSNNWLMISIQPEQHIRMEMTVKQAGLDMLTDKTSMDAIFSEESDERDAYEDLLLDVFEGEQSLFLSSEEISTAWRIVEPLLKAWESDSSPIEKYEAGSWGPLNTRKIFHDKHLRWRHNLEGSDTGWSINSEGK